VAIRGPAAAEFGVDRSDLVGDVQVGSGGLAQAQAGTSLAEPRKDPANLDVVTMVGAADVGRLAQWMALLCTLFGLATMHTLGRAAGPVDAHRHPVASATTAMTTADADAPATRTAAVVVAAVTDPCEGDDCAGHPGHGGPSGWSVCLAVLGGLAVAVLLAASLLRRARHRGSTGDEPVWNVARPRPPPRPAGSIVASVAVLRI
jgi:hypothetical protein